jgi:hypothetical protein
MKVVIRQRKPPTRTRVPRTGIDAGAWRGCVFTGGRKSAPER